MSASKFTRNKDYSDDANNNAGGRSTIDPAGLDGEIDEILAVTEDHADKLDVLLRDDLTMQEDILQGHEFSSAALSVIAAVLGAEFSLVWTGAYATSQTYVVGNFAEASGSTYIALKNQAAGAYADFAAALADGAWGLVAASGSAGIGTGSANDILYWDGAAYAWGKLSAAMAPLFAVKAAPAFTGLMSLVAVKTGRIDLTSGAAVAIDLNAGPNQNINPLSNNVTFSTSNRAAASGEVKMADVRIVCDGTNRTFTFPAWRWVTSVPASISAGKAGILSLRCYGANEADVLAGWAVEA